MPETEAITDDKPLLHRAIEEIDEGAADTPRPAQAKLSGWASETYVPETEQNHLVARAPTGSGKGLSYLAPAFERAVTGERTLISSEGLGLQRQLTTKDAPAVAKAAYEKYGVQVTTGLLKGFGNYVCVKKAETSVRQLLDTKGSLAGRDLANAIEAQNCAPYEPIRLGYVTSTWETLSALSIWALRDGRAWTVMIARSRFLGRSGRWSR